MRRMVALGLGLSLIAAGCTPTTPAQNAVPAVTAPPANAMGGNLNVRLTGDWDVLDPSGPVIANVAGGEILMGTYDRLVENQPKGDPLPYLAKSWKYTDSATIMFDLRP